MRRISSFALFAFKIILISILQPSMAWATKNETASLANIEPAVFASSVLKPAMGDYYGNFQFNYSFLSRIKFKIINVDPRYEYLSRHNRLEFSPYLDIINKNISEMDAFIANISSSLNINLSLVRLGFGLPLNASQPLTDQGSFLTGRLLADNYWQRHPGNTQHVNNWFNERPPPVLFGSFYPQYIAMLNNDYLSNISRQAVLANNKIIQTAAEDKQRQIDDEAYRLRMQEERRLALQKEEFDKAEAIKRQNLEKIANERIVANTVANRLSEWKIKSVPIYAEFDRINSIGPGYCERLTGISTGVVEFISRRLRVNPNSVQYRRSTYLPISKYSIHFNTFGIGMHTVDGLLESESSKIADAPSCVATIYTNTGVVECKADRAQIRGGTILECLLW